MVLKFFRATRDSFFENWPSDWPAKDRFVSQHDVTATQLVQLTDLLRRRVGEREIERFLAKNREVLALTIFLFSTGHHAAWLYPKQQIRPNGGTDGGLVPDYVAAGANSDGLSWWVLELKGTDKRAFRNVRGHVSLTLDASSGICQLINYMDSADRSQAYLRDELRLAGFSQPRGILLIGTEEESEDPKVRQFKGAWNRFNPRVQIRSYSALLRELTNKVAYQAKQEEQRG